MLLSKSFVSTDSTIAAVGFSKSGAKVLLFFDMCKNLLKKQQKNVIKVAFLSAPNDAYNRPSL